MIEQLKKEHIVQENVETEEATVSNEITTTVTASATVESTSTTEKVVK